MMPFRARRRVRARVIAGGATDCWPIHDPADNDRDVPRIDLRGLANVEGTGPLRQTKQASFVAITRRGAVY